jgi:hypothetical protein
MVEKLVMYIGVNNYFRDLMFCYGAASTLLWDTALRHWAGVYQMSSI